jgi:hypothetical protein
MKRAQWPVLYVILGTLVVVAAAISQLAPDQEVVQRFGPNIATETLGILLTLMFVQRFLERQDRVRRLRSSLGALRRGSRALRRLIDAWGVVIKGGLRNPPRYPPDSLLELFESHYTPAVGDIDPDDPVDDSGIAWGAWLAREIRASREALREVIRVYGTSLDAEYVEALDSLIDDEFFDILIQLVEDREGRSAWHVRIRQMAGARDIHFRRLCAVVELHNGLAQEAAAIRDSSRLPQTRGVGVDLPPDYDLRVAHTVDGRWWKAAPAPGSLRVSGSRSAAH